MEMVLVTGGSGYIAGFCIAQLLERGYRVRTTVRNLSRENDVRAGLSRLVDPGDRLTFFAADLSADSGWREAAEGADYVLHVASPFVAQTQPEEAFVVPARDGALRVVRAGLDAGAKRIVMTSSTQATTYPKGPAPLPRDESCWTDPTRPDVSFYGRSKVIAERAAWDLVAREGARERFAVVCPGGVFGPVLGRDYSFSLTVIERMLKGALPGLPRLGFDIVDVRDIADLHLRAMTDPAAAGERFIGANGFRWFEEIADTLRRELGPAAAKVPTRRIPGFVIQLLAMVDPEVRSVAKDVGKRRENTSAKARERLGWAPRSPEESVVDCARSLIAEGVV